MESVLRGVDAINDAEGGSTVANKAVQMFSGGGGRWWWCGGVVEQWRGGRFCLSLIRCDLPGTDATVPMKEDPIRSPNCHPLAPPPPIAIGVVDCRW